MSDRGTREILGVGTRSEVQDEDGRFHSIRCSHDSHFDSVSFRECVRFICMDIPGLELTYSDFKKKKTLRFNIWKFRLPTFPCFFLFFFFYSDFRFQFRLRRLELLNLTFFSSSFCLTCSPGYTRRWNVPMNSSPAAVFQKCPPTVSPLCSVEQIENTGCSSLNKFLSTSCSGIVLIAPDKFAWSPVSFSKSEGSPVSSNKSSEPLISSSESVGSQCFFKKFT